MFTFMYVSFSISFDRWTPPPDRDQADQRSDGDLDDQAKGHCPKEADARRAGNFLPIRGESLCNYG